MVKMVNFMLGVFYQNKTLKKNVFEQKQPAGMDHMIHCDYKAVTGVKRMRPGDPAGRPGRRPRLPLGGGPRT